MAHSIQVTKSQSTGQHLEDDTEIVIHMHITQHRNSSNNFNMNKHQPESLQQNSY